MFSKYGNDNVVSAMSRMVHVTTMICRQAFACLVISVKIHDLQHTVLKAIKLPAGVTDLDTSLTNVDGDNFTHDG